MSAAKKQMLDGLDPLVRSVGLFYDKLLYARAAIHTDQMGLASELLEQANAHYVDMREAAKRGATLDGEEST